MSLDLSGKSGVAYSTTAITSAAGFLASVFDATELSSAGSLKVKVDTSAGQVDLSSLAAPSTFPFLEDGTEVTFIKSSVDANSVRVDDATPGTNFNGFSGVDYTYVNRPGESITIRADLSNDKWGVEI